MDNERLPWWLAHVCLRAHHIRCRSAKLAQLIVCHLLKTFVKLVDIERRQLNFLHRIRPCGTCGKRCPAQLGKRPNSEPVRNESRFGDRGRARNSGQAQVVDHGLSSDAQVLPNLDLGLSSLGAIGNGVTDWTHT